MADINVERKGPSIWPWVIGLLVLALLIWAIAEMVDTDEEVAIEEEPVEEVTQPPAAVVDPQAAPPGTGPEPAELNTLKPFGSDDIGRRVKLSGEVVGEPLDNGFWVDTETNGEDVIWVKAPVIDEAGDTLAIGEIEEGEMLTVYGRIERLSTSQADQAIESAGLRDEENYEDWTVQREFMIGPLQQPLESPQARDTQTSEQSMQAREPVGGPS